MTAIFPAVTVNGFFVKYFTLSQLPNAKKTYSNLVYLKKAAELHSSSCGPYIPS